ncbi:dipeptide/oligopeptide/nickel ABC transporter ATP-binding protein [Lachnoclostridium sp. An14]|uniref:ABC transporter ATP-binding protein n=1 Tax=Lachnoclostridium sp. An14 TaxID=1965562 RepID=UPI000B3B0902|nr:ABC transporter ATP-binding protein [Lachnoclostridium sp. An14]OUQ19732.1 dipeptide/oligopeptide/nickel ABC transporter ATP-binding protein [Lachnoclostridium sp. An14]
MSEKNLLEVKGLKTYFHTFKGVVKAVDDVSFEIKPGEILGIVGESGSGKSVTSFSLLKLVEPPGVVEAEQILFDGKDLTRAGEKEMTKIRGKDISMVFQDPMTSLNPLYTIQKQMEEVLILHEPGMSKAQRKERCIELLSAVGIPNPKERLREYPNQFSGGMRQRVIIAIALATNPKLLIADEPTTALDVTIQEQILKLMKKLVRENHTALILITHDLAVVSRMVDKINVMYCGKLVETGTTEDVIKRNAHPYTEGLLNSIPKLYEDRERLDFIPGMVPNMFDLPAGCYFAPRCKYCQEICRSQQPQMREIAPGHKAACHFPLIREKAEGEVE